MERMAAKSRGSNRTPGGRELVKPATVIVPRNRQVPEPPAKVAGRGLEEWQRVWEAGYWLKPDQDYHWVEMIAKAYEDIGVFRSRIEDDGLVVQGYAGQVVAHPLIGEIRKCEATIQKCLSVLGFSPSDRARLAITEAKARSALQEMIDGAGR